MPTARRCTGSRFASGRSTYSCRRCSSPAAQHWRAALARGAQQPAHAALPAAGAATLAAEADARGAALAYRRLGREWLRIDLADRLASHARKVRSAGGADPVDAALATSIGLDEEALGRLMAEVGFTRAGDAWRWRGRRGPRPRPPLAAPSHAFAELAKLSARAVRIDRYPALHPAGEEPHPRPVVIETGHVRIDGKRVEKPSEEVRAGSVVALPLRGQVRVLRVLALPQRRGPRGRSARLLRRAGN